MFLSLGDLVLGTELFGYSFNGASTSMNVPSLVSVQPAALRIFLPVYTGSHYTVLGLSLYQSKTP